MAPSQPKPEKQIIGARIERELYHKVETLSASRKLPMSQFLIEVLERETRDVALTPEQYEEIAQEIRLAKAGKNPRKQKSRKKD